MIIVKKSTVKVFNFDSWDCIGIILRKLNYGYYIILFLAEIDKH